MDTTTAAQQAGVTVATIRTWCRIGAVAAEKVARRWVIAPASLARRIEIGRKTVDAPVYLTSKTRKVRGHIAAFGLRAQLAAAYQAGTPVTLSGKHAGEKVYLGHRQQTYGDYGITLETIAEDDRWTTPNDEEAATFLIDFTRLDEAPRLAALVDADRNDAANAAAEAEARAAAEERELERSEDGA